ncbi:25S rRNA adenine-N(1) methyltransferase-like [Stylophora pistillata]|nr:25S rRNA adenine-N(1) methyltransferase-like [Stylophora pistillata]
MADITSADSFVSTKVTKHCETERPEKKSKVRKKRKTPKKPVVEINSRKDRRIINEFHALNKKIDSLRRNTLIQIKDRPTQIAALEAKKEKLGGINAYQKASKLGEARHGSFNSAKWILKQMRDLDVCKVKPDPTEATEGLRLLDVGALDNNYKKHQKWIQCTPIDLNPQSDVVVKADFLKFKGNNLYDVVVLSLVINFEGDVHRRGKMLRKCQELIVDQGYLFIVLPLPCLNNSRYLNDDLFVSMMESLGFKVCACHKSRKLSFYMFRKTGHAQVKSFPKRVLRKGGNHNNFAIVL